MRRRRAVTTRIALAAATFLLAAAPTPGFATADPVFETADAAVAAIDAALERGDIGAAEVAVDAARAAFPDDDRVARAWIDVALVQERHATALRRLRASGWPGDAAAKLQWRAAQAYFGLGTLLGEVDIRTVPHATPGTLHGAWLVLEPRPGTDRFLCAPAESAVYQVRAALDGGLDEPAVHALHARIWRRLGQPERARAILAACEADLLRRADPETLAPCAAVMLAAGDLRAYLRFERRRAALCPAEEGAIMGAAYAAVADWHLVRGEARLYRAWLVRAVEAQPDNADCILLLGDAEWRAGRPARAAALYRRVLAARADHAERLRLLERIAQVATRPETDWVASKNPGGEPTSRPGPCLQEGATRKQGDPHNAQAP
jgi:tetratricopeptide (TPR) repeat protein